MIAVIPPMKSLDKILAALDKHREHLMASHVIRTRIIVARSLAGLILAVVLAGAGGCASDKKVMAVANNVHTGLTPVVIEDPELQAYFHKIGVRIVEVAAEMDKQGYGPRSHTSADDNAWMFTNKVKFYLVNSETLNAFTTGGEHMYVYNQLFLNCKSEDELAAVMAHEYAHIYARHVSKSMDRQVGKNVGTGVVGVGAGIATFFLGGGLSRSVSTASSAASVASSAGEYVGMGFTRGDENEADDIGFVFYTRAGWDPDRFADFFQAMIDAGYDGTPEMLSDHPKLASRVANTKKRAAALPPDAAQWRKPPIADEKQFAALRQKAAQLAKTLPNDQAVQNAQTILASFPSCVSTTKQPVQRAARSKVRTEAFKAQFK